MRTACPESAPCGVMRIQVMLLQILGGRCNDCPRQSSHLSSLHDYSAQQIATEPDPRSLQCTSHRKQYSAWNRQHLAQHIYDDSYQHHKQDTLEGDLSISSATTFSSLVDKQVDMMRIKPTFRLATDRT